MGKNFKHVGDQAGRAAFRGRGARFFSRLRCSREKSAGFTVAELLLVLGIIAVIVAVVLPTLVSRRSRAELDSSTRQIVALLREAQNRSFSQEDGVSWGVHFDNPIGTAPFYALFKDFYSAANIVVRQSLPNRVGYSPSSIPAGGALDVVFSKVTGLPLSEASISLEMAGDAAVSTINIDSTGLVSF